MGFNLDQALFLVHTRDKKTVASAGAKKRRLWRDAVLEQDVVSEPDPDGLLTPGGKAVFRPGVFRDALAQLNAISNPVRAETQRGAVERLAAAAGMTVAEAIKELAKHPVPSEDEDDDDEDAIESVSPFQASELALFEALAAGEIIALSSASGWSTEIPAGQFSDSRCEITFDVDGKAQFRLAARAPIGSRQGVIRAFRSAVVDEPDFPVETMLKRFPYAVAGSTGTSASSQPTGGVNDSGQAQNRRPVKEAKKQRLVMMACQWNDIRAGSDLNQTINGRRDRLPFRAAEVLQIIQILQPLSKGLTISDGTVTAGRLAYDKLGPEDQIALIPPQLRKDAMARDPLMQMTRPVSGDEKSRPRTS